MMKILALETSGKACSVAISEDEKLLGETFLHNGFTHSKTLLPAVVHLLASCDLKLEEIDILAVAVGPGSFTGLRIGVSTVKGLGFASDLPCAPCSTLKSMAWQLAHLEGYTIISVMDARKNQVYHSRFLIKNGEPQRLSPDGAISLEELAVELEGISTPMILIGDGAELAFGFLENVEIAPENLRMQRAQGVALEGLLLKKEGQLLQSEELVPEYHRLSQAEREKLEKMRGNEKEAT